jgi:integrase
MEIMGKVWMDARNRDLKTPSVRNALYEVARLLKWAQGRNRTFDQLTQDDMRQYYAEDNRGHNSKATSRVLLKSRLKRLGRKDLADAARYLTLKIDEKKIDVLTDEDVLAMMNATENMQWQLRLMTLWDTGARAGELQRENKGC